MLGMQVHDVRVLRDDPLTLSIKVSAQYQPNDDHIVALKKTIEDLLGQAVVLEISHSRRVL